MRAKAFFSSISRPGIFTMVCLLVMLLAFGCKQKKEDVGGDDQNKGARSEGQVQEFAFDMHEVSVFDVVSVSRDFVRGQTTICNDPFVGDLPGLAHRADTILRLTRLGGMEPVTTCSISTATATLT